MARPRMGYAPKRPLRQSNIKLISKVNSFWERVNRRLGEGSKKAHRSLLLFEFIFVHHVVSTAAGGLNEILDRREVLYTIPL